MHKPQYYYYHGQHNRPEIEIFDLVAILSFRENESYLQIARVYRQKHL